MTNLMCIRRESCMALGHSIFVPLAEFLSKYCTNLKFLIEPSVCPHKKQSYQWVGQVASIHRAAGKWVSRKSRGHKKSLGSSRLLPYLSKFCRHIRGAMP